MNTRKQVLIMSALLLVMLIVTAGYAAWYPSRASDAEDHFEEATAERASITFARQCRLCHGDQAEGGALGGRLPAAPALNRPDLQGFLDTEAVLEKEMNTSTDTLEVDNVENITVGQVILIDEERMEVKDIDGNTLTVKRAVEHTEAAGHFADAVVYGFDETTYTTAVKLITNTITCGRVGTAMPAWAQDQGGPLSDEQIRQLMVLITTARWDLVAHHNDIEDKVSATLLEPITPDTRTIRVSDVTRFNDEAAIRIGDERLRIKELPNVAPAAADKSGLIQVERGILGTIAEDHGTDVTIYNFPEPSNPAILESSCGQTARAPAPQGTPGTIEPFTGQTVEISALNVAFSTDELTVNAGGQVRIRFTNNEAVPHNIAVYEDDSAPVEPVADGSVGVTFEGPNVVDDTVFDIPAAGEYFFRCDVHPTLMTGDFIVR
jgi:plastocyanin/mono/diheme cytochrome c family protein